MVMGPDLIYQEWALAFQAPIKLALMAQYRGVRIVDLILWVRLLE